MFSRQAAPRRASGSSRTALAGWVHACLWLLLAMLPLRGLAAAQMMVAPPAHAPAHAACHQAAPAAANPQQAVASDLLAGPSAAAPHADADAAAGEVGHGCVCCLFCAPALSGALATVPGLPVADDRGPMSDAGPTPDGLHGRLLRPPRG